MSSVEVVRAVHSPTGASTGGILRERAFADAGAVFSKSTVAGGVVSGWHHHDLHTLYGHVVSGRLRLEFPRESVEVAEGDFFKVLPGKVHRDVNPDKTRPVVIVSPLVGEGEAVVNVSPPA